MVLEAGGADHCPEWVIGWNWVEYGCTLRASGCKHDNAIWSSQIWQCSWIPQYQYSSLFTRYISSCSRFGF